MFLIADLDLILDPSRIQVSNSFGSVMIHPVPSRNRQDDRSPAFPLIKGCRSEGGPRRGFNELDPGADLSTPLVHVRCREKETKNGRKQEQDQG